MTVASLSIVGAGPGADDLLTVRGARRIAAADIVLYTPAAAAPAWLRTQTRDGAELIDLATPAAEDVPSVLRRAVRDHRSVVRLLPVDPASWPELRSLHETGRRLGIRVEVVPGVSQVSAVAAALGVALVEPGHARTVLLAGADLPARTTETTLALRAPAARAEELVTALLADGHPADTPVAVAYQGCGRADTVVSTTLRDLVPTVRQHKVWRTALFLIGSAVRPNRPRTGAGPAAPCVEPAARPASLTRYKKTSVAAKRRAKR